MAQITFTERERGDDFRHGTNSGAARHAASGEPPCDACRAAKAEYDKRWRSGDEQTRKNRLHAKAQARASGELRRSHPDEYRTLYLKHKKLLTAEFIAARNDKEAP